MSKPIVARLTKNTPDYPKGAELGFETVAKATSVLGDGAFTVVSYQDGSEYETPKAASTSSNAKSDKDATS